MSDNDNDRWLTVSEASGEFGISERTLQRRIKAGTVESKLENRRRLVLASSVAENGTVGGAVAAPLAENLEKENQQLRDRISELEQELRQKDDTHRQEMADLAEQIKQKDEDLRRERAAAEEANHRHDIVVMQMTRLLEYHQQPFWRRLFSRKALPPPEQIMDMEPEGGKSKE